MRRLSIIIAVLAASLAVPATAGAFTTSQGQSNFWTSGPDTCQTKWSILDVENQFTYTHKVTICASNGALHFKSSSYNFVMQDATLVYGTCPNSGDSWWNTQIGDAVALHSHMGKVRKSSGAIVFPDSGIRWRAGFDWDIMWNNPYGTEC